MLVQSSIARTPFGIIDFVQDMGSSSHWDLIIVPGQDANDDDITKTYLYNFDSLKTPLLYSKTGVYRGIQYFSYFCSKT